MHIKNRTAATIYRMLFVVMCAVALVIEFGFLRGQFNLYTLNYYTILSNLACLVFFVASLRRDRPRAEGAIVYCIAITGIIYATLLAPGDLASGHFFTFKNMALHYVGPLMVVLDGVLFNPKGHIRATDPLLWLLMPLGYFGYILLRSTFAGNIGPTDSPFPYAFIDPAVQGGWGPMMQGVGWIAIGMLALGYLIWFIDRGMARS